MRAITFRPRLVAQLGPTSLMLLVLVGCGSPQAEMSKSAAPPSERESETAAAVVIDPADAVEQPAITEETVAPEASASWPDEAVTESLPAEAYASEAVAAQPIRQPIRQPIAANASRSQPSQMRRESRPPIPPRSTSHSRNSSGFGSNASRPGGFAGSSAAARPSPARIVRPTPSPPTVPEISPKPTATPELAASTAPAVTPSIAAASIEPVPEGPIEVEVFYATDRKRVASIAGGDLWRVFGWGLQLGLLAIITGTIGLMYQRQGVKLVAAAASIGCLVLSYGGWIEWQERARLKDNGNVWYTHDIKLESQPALVSANSIGDHEPLDYGRCLVSIPPNHQTGIVEAPSITRFELTEDREKHVVLERITQSDSSAFFNDLNTRLNKGSDEALIFVHGYNVSFNDAVKRTAQISHDVKFQGAPICYSWPSHGGLEDYTRDMANADWSVIHLQSFLASLFEQSKARKVHLIAHSMGNRVLMQALDRLALQNQQDTRFGQIVLAAPDVSANDFRQRYSDVIRGMADHVTLYASSRDRALMVSAEVHGHDRAGLAGNGIVIVDGIDTIDVSHVDTSLIGHSYYGDTPELIDDLAAIILQARPTTSRTWLERIDTAANRFYWKFR